jgi:adenylate cyclase
MRIRLGYQLSITSLFVFVVLGVGLALVYLSFDRAKAISRSAAVTYIDRVAEHTADTVDQNFASVLQAVEVSRPPSGRRRAKKTGQQRL